MQPIITDFQIFVFKSNTYNVVHLLLHLTAFYPTRPDEWIFRVITMGVQGLATEAVEEEPSLLLAGLGLHQSGFTRHFPF